MKKLYFLGGENIIKRDAKEANTAAFDAAGGLPRVLVFAWARPSFDARFKRRRLIVDYFRSIGAVAVEFAEFSDSLNIIASKVAQSNLIYLTGGQVGALLSRLKESGVDSLLRSFEGVIVGRSAGAMALGKNCLVTNRYNGNRTIAHGLGMVDFSIKAHYNESYNDLLTKVSKKEKIFAIPQGAAVVWNEGVTSFIGNVVLFENGVKTSQSSQSANF